MCGVYRSRLGERLIWGHLVNSLSGTSMAKISELYGLNKVQAELDFVDIDVNTDTPLYIDPYAFTTREDTWSEQCHDQIVSFFDAIISAIANNDQNRGIRLLSNLSEPKETHLGVSQNGNTGRGIGQQQATDLYRTLARSKAAETGLLNDLSDFALFIPGIGRDKISDLTTNVIRSSLIEYTQAQCSIFGIPMVQVASGFYWCAKDLEWKQDYKELPVHNGSKILLVPKYAVRYSLGVDSSKYRSMYVLEFLQAEHLRADDGLVSVIRDKNGAIKRKVVFKKNVDRITPRDKDFLADFSSKNPEVIENYKKALRESASQVPNICDENFHEEVLAAILKEQLIGIPKGSKDATKYHDLCIGILSFLFFPNLIYPEKEAEINQGRKRIDIRYTNGKESGLFYRISLDGHVIANMIMVECKNYTNEIANPEIDQLVGRFDLNRGRFGFLCFRDSDDLPRLKLRCRDVARQGNGVVLPMDDAFIISCLDSVINMNRTYIDYLVNELYKDVIS